MNRLQRELQRLYGPQADAGLGLGLDARRMVDALGRVRAMVLELARPADWAALSAVWGGVQADLALRIEAPKALLPYFAAARCSRQELDGDRLS